MVNPTLATLARPFGLAPLIDKPVAILPDARLSGRPDNAAITECLLSISGEDDQTVDRKHLPAWTGRLPTRFVLISNELPRLRDASGALASRLILLRFTRSFYGREDVGLFDRLSRELPGILRGQSPAGNGCGTAVGPCNPGRAAISWPPWATLPARSPPSFVTGASSN